MRIPPGADLGRPDQLRLPAGAGPEQKLVAGRLQFQYRRIVHLERAHDQLARVVEQIGQVGVRDRVLAELGDGRLLPDAILQLLLNLDLFGDVPDDRRDTDDLARFVPHRRDLHRDVAHGAIGRGAFDLEGRDLLAPPHPQHQIQHLAVAGGRDDLGDVLADHLIGRVAVNPLRRRVPADNRAVEVLADDGIVRGFDDRGQDGARHRARRRIYGGGMRYRRCS